MAGNRSAIIEPLGEASRRFVASRGPGARCLTACEGLSSSRGTTGRFVLHVPLGEREVRTTIDLPLEPRAAPSAVRQLDAIVGDLQTLLQPLPLVTEQSCRAYRTGPHERIAVHWEGIRFEAEPMADGWMYRAAGLAVEPTVLRTLAAEVRRQRQLGRNV